MANDNRRPSTQKRGVVKAEGVGNRRPAAWGQKTKRTKSLDKFRERKERKRQQTAKSLRAYQKACKSMGYSPGKGASRKRDDTSEGDLQEGDVVSQDTHQENDIEAPSQEYRKRKKSSMFQKASVKAARRKEELAQQQAQNEANAEERSQKLKERKQKTRKMRQRTARGQPIMQNIVHNILDKLQKGSETTV